MVCAISHTQLNECDSHSICLNHTRRVCLTVVECRADPFSPGYARRVQGTLGECGLGSAVLRSCPYNCVNWKFAEAEKEEEAPR